MTAAKAFNGFKRKCGDFREELDTFSAKLDTITIEEAALQISHSMQEEWEGISTNYDELEDKYPEVLPEPPEDGNPVPSVREVLYKDLRRTYFNIKIKAVCKIADLKTTGCTCSCTNSTTNTCSDGQQTEGQERGGGSGAEEKDRYPEGQG